MPGLTFPHHIWTEPHEDLQLRENVDMTIPKAANLCLVKLHGSINWRSSSDGGQCLVMGTEKSAQIENEPLLRWYSDLLKRVLYRNRVKLAVVGYVFGDKHINKVISKAMREFELELHVVLPKDLSKFLEMMEASPNGEDLKHARLWQHRVAELYEDREMLPNLDGRKLLGAMGIRNFAQEFEG